MKKAAVKKAAPKQPRQPTRKVALADARKASAVRDEETAALQEGDDLPLLVVTGKPRPRARLQLGKGGPVYIVTKPKDDYYWALMDQLDDLQALSVLTGGGLEELTPEQSAQLRSAVAVLNDFVTCAFAPEDHQRVLDHLRDGSTAVATMDLADAMNTLMTEVWAAPEPDEA